MSASTRLALQLVDASQETISCQACDAVCCRLTVVVMANDQVPRHLVVRNAQGLEVMAQNEEGWCMAVDPLHMRCSIYEQRPSICRKFAMGSEYCREERIAYRTLHQAD